MSGRRRRTHRLPSLSQHFLRSQALAASLIAESNIQPGDTVIEIGAGLGTLTRELACLCSRVVAVEVDVRLVQGLRAEFGVNAGVSLVHADFLTFPLPAEDYKVFGNIPFGRTAEIVRTLVESPNPPNDIYCIVQREAAERFAGEPYAQETVRSLLLKPWWHVEILRRLSRSDFDPPPSVDSVMLWLALRQRPLVEPDEAACYRDFVAPCFGRSGNTIRRCLRGIFTGRQVARLARDLRFDPATAPSAVSFERWLGIFRYLEANGARPRGR